MRLSIRRSAILLVVAAISGAPQAGELLWHVEEAGGRTVSSGGADRPFNPASVLKVGTSWWALERLGPEHRYTTAFGHTGVWNRSTGTLDGQLVVRGGGDPDFQPENAFLVARELERLGLREVRGGLLVEGPFLMGWEGGPERRKDSVEERLLAAGRRLMEALDSRRWDRESREAWRELCERRGWKNVRPPRLRMRGPVVVGAAAAVRPLVEHRSNPLPVLLKRFNVYSNNDIERIADGLGGPAGLQVFLRDRLEDREGRIVVSTACGEGSNLMTPRLVVRMLRRFQRDLGRSGLSPRDLLPVPGCDPGPVPRMFPALAEGPLRGAVTCKTGTLRKTDGGVAVLAGWFTTLGGEELLFCVASPGAGEDLAGSRSREQRWLLDLMERSGRAARRPCGAPLLFSDERAMVVPMDRTGGNDAAR